MTLSWSRVTGILTWALSLPVLVAPDRASAVTIELTDVAADRVERQRKAADGELPLPGTPDLANLPGRLAGIGAQLGDAAFIRVFKAESELEIWLMREGRYVHFATYPICYWSGSLGPKMREGDKQTPEGFYTISRRQLHRAGRWPRSLNLGYPNVFDRAQARNGSYILVHGGCTSVGCFAMTNPVMREVYDVIEAALRKGQAHVPVHVFPFRMTAEALARQQFSPWYSFWSNLKEGYDAFEQTNIPPKVAVCENKYRFEAALTAGREIFAGPLAVCGENLAAISVLERLYKVAGLRPSSLRAVQANPLLQRRARLADLKERLRDGLIDKWAGASLGRDDEAIASVAAANVKFGNGRRSSSRSRRASNTRSASTVQCTMARASCRKYVAMRRNVAQKAAKARVRTASGRSRVSQN